MDRFPVLEALGFPWRGGRPSARSGSLDGEHAGKWQVPHSGSCKAGSRAPSLRFPLWPVGGGVARLRAAPGSSLRAERLQAGVGETTDKPGPGPDTREQWEQ